MNKRRMSARERVANHLGFDIAEMNNYRYQSTRTAFPVYAVGDAYYCALPVGKKPGTGWRKEQAQDGWVVWMSDVGPE